MYRPRFIHLLVALVSAPFISFSVAQTPQDRSDAARATAIAEQRVLQQQEAQTRAENMKTSSVRLDRGGRVGELTLPVEQPCFDIAEFVLIAPEMLPPPMQALAASALPQDPFAFAREWLERYQGYCVGSKGIEVLVKNLNALILNRGYITSRVSVADHQNLAGGRLILELIPGTINSIHFDDPTIYGTWRSAFPARPGDLLDLPALEQGLEQMKQLSSQDVDIKIMPAESLGQSDVVVVVNRTKPWRLTESVSNIGYRSTGKIQGALNLGIDNPLGLNDQLGIGVSHSLGQKDKSSKGWNVYYTVPYGYWSVSFAGYGSDYRQQVIGTAQSFIASGESQGGELRINRVLSRGQEQILGAFVKLGKRFSKGFIEDTEIPSQNRNNTYIEVGLTERHYLGNAQLDVDVAHRQGVPWLGATAAPPGFSQTYYYKMQVVNANLKLPFSLAGRRAVYTTSFHAQYTRDKLFLVDGLSIGNRWTVRGFDGETTLIGEKGFYWRNEVQTALPGTDQVIYSGLDYGRVAGPATRNQTEKQLAGLVIGSRGGWASDRLGTLSFDLFLGTPLYKPQNLPAANLTLGFTLAHQY